MTSIALVVLDTLRKDSFDAEFGWLPGKRFENAYSTGSWTVPAHASLFAGKYPSELGVHSKNRYLNCPEETLAEVLSQSGYITVSYSCNPYVSHAFDFDRGFDEFDGSWRLQHLDPDLFNWKGFISDTRDEGPSRYLRALWKCLTNDCKTLASLRHGVRLKMRSMNKSAGQVQDDGAQSALKFLKQREFGTDEFLFVNLMEAHAPYVPPQEYRTVELDERPGLIQTVSDGSFQNPDRIRRAYEDCVKYLSDIYQDIFAELSQDFDYVITIGDHGEMFGERGVWAHTHGVYPELTHVPLSIYGDGFEGTYNQSVSIIDIHRTILQIADVKAKSRGRDLLNSSEPVDRLTECMGLTRDDADQLSRTGISEQKIQKYDTEYRGILSNEGDYGYETVRGFTQKTEDSLEKRLSKLTKSMEIRQVNEKAENELPSRVSDQLEDLGYA